jgi:hypothetical protein
MDSFDERDHGQEIEEALLALERIGEVAEGELPGWISQPIVSADPVAAAFPASDPPSSLRCAA